MNKIDTKLLLKKFVEKNNLNLTNNEKLIIRLAILTGITAQLKQDIEQIDILKNKPI